MSGLDMVLQRQVPVRPAGKAGESSVGAGMGAEFKKDAFSAVLSGEKRSAGSARDRQGVQNDPEAEAAENTGVIVADEPDSVGEGATQSDEMLALLEGLTSSAAFSGDAQMGADSGGLTEAQLLESVLSNEAGAETADELSIRIVQPGSTGVRQSTSENADQAAEAMQPPRTGASASAKPEPVNANTPGTAAHGAATAVPAATAAAPVAPATAAVPDAPATAAAPAAPATAAVPAAPATAAVPAAPATAAMPAASATAAVPAAPATAAVPAAPATAAVPAAPATAAVPAVPATAAVPAAPATAAVPAATVGLGTTAGRGGQAAPTPVNSSRAAAAPDRQSAIAEVNQVRGILGLDSEARPVRSSDGKATPDERTVGSPAPKGADPERMPGDRTEIKSRVVEVVESRRSLANQSLTENTQLVTRAIIEAGDVTLSAPRTTPSAQAALIPGQTKPGQMLHTLKIQLNPVSLGSVTAELKLSGENLSVTIKVETAAAYRQLNDDNQSILKALRAQGYGVEQITIQYVAAPDRSANLTQQAGFQPGAQSAGSGDAQASGRETSGQGAGQRGNSRNEEHHREHSPNSAAGAVRSDGVYL